MILYPIIHFSSIVIVVLQSPLIIFKLIWGLVDPRNLQTLHQMYVKSSGLNVIVNQVLFNYWEFLDFQKIICLRNQ